MSIPPSQLAQVKQGGLGILSRKLKKAAGLLLMNVAAPVAVYFKLDWPAAYDFVFTRFFIRIKKLRVGPNANRLLVGRLIDQLISCVEKSTDKDPGLPSFPSWMRRHLLLADLYRSSNELEKSLDIYRKVHKGQRYIAEKYGLDDLGFEFIPRALPLGSIGVYEYLEMNMKARILDLRPKKKMILLLPQNAVINNRCYLKYWNEYLTIISDPTLIEMLARLEALLTAQVVSFAHFRGKLYWSPLSQGMIREHWRQEGHPPFFTLSDEDYKKCWDCLKKMGLSKDAWFVTLHVREPGWRDDRSYEENFRNADISTYLPAIKAITDAGGWVLRIGDPGMSKLPKIPQVIDYAHSEFKSDWMDIFLCAQCRFMIGTSSGMCVVAASFGVPLVMTNLLPAYAVYHFTSQDVFIPKLCFSKGEKNYLNFEELISPPVGAGIMQSHFDKHNLLIIDNTAEEIKGLVEEMLEKCAGTLRYSKEDEILQKKFREITESSGKLYGDLGLVTKARIGKKFLLDHSVLLSAKVTESAEIES